MIPLLAALFLGLLCFVLGYLFGSDFPRKEL